MSTSIDARADVSTRSVRSMRTGGVYLALSGVTFFAGGITHPADSGGGSKVDQLYEAFMNPSWYPSHAFLLAAFAFFAAALWQLRQRRDLEPTTLRLVHAVSIIALVSTLGMAVHLFAALGAESIADGRPALIYEVQKWNETIISTLWGLGVIGIAVTGGTSRVLGNRIVMPLGVVGGLAWCVATATIAFTDRFDPLFPISSLISVWAIAAGVLWIGDSRGRAPI